MKGVIGRGSLSPTRFLLSKRSLFDNLSPFAGVAACKILNGAGVRSEMRFRTDDVFGTQTIWQVSRTGGNLHRFLPGWHDATNKCCGNWTPDEKLLRFRKGRPDLGSA